jgi:alpha-amylase
MRIAIAAVLAAALLGCQSRSSSNVSQQATAATASVAHPEWSRNAAIYEVNVRQFTPEGTLAAFKRHLPRLDSLGVDILWIMPVQPIGTLNRKGSLGSYYSIRDYTAVNPEFGTEADFKSVVDEAHRLGMKVILDWVPNHTSFDHEWTVSNKNFYTLRSDGSISVARDNEGKETDWTDVADLNYDNPDMRRAMIGELLWWVQRTGLDGFRVDVAWGIPYDFWPQLRSALDSARAGMFLLAEAEDPKLHQWYDMTYGWELHHLLNEVTQGKKSTGDLSKYFEKQRSTYPGDAYRMYFTSNHDENSWQGTEFERMGVNNAPAFVLSATAQNGMPLVYTGQEVTLNKRLRFFEKDTVNWTGPSRVGFFKTMLDLKHSQVALRNGAEGGAQTELKTDGGDRVFAFTRSRDANTVVVAVNFGDAPARIRYEGLGATGTYIDWFTKASADLSATGTLDIPANGYRVLVK